MKIDYSALVALALLLCCAACGSDDDSDNTATNQDTQTSDGASQFTSGGQEAHSGHGAAMGTPGPPGCYDISVHMCDCALSESACAEASRMWTELCNCRVTSRPIRKY